MSARYRRALAPALCLLMACGGRLNVGEGDYRWIGADRRLPEGKGALRVVWLKELTKARRGNYRPVEHAVAALDERHGRVYAGSQSGELHALSFGGTALYRFELHQRIASELALDVVKNELYVGTERGALFSFAPAHGALRWRAATTGPVRQKPVLFRDAVYVVTEEDTVEALARSDGGVLWTYRRERSDEFLMAGHAGLHLGDDGVLYTAFNDGTVVALDALDGRPKWERDTAMDAPETEPGMPRYVDVDTTPVVIGDQVFAASFGAGLYCLDRHNGSVLWREPTWTGITGITQTPNQEALILVSADRGLARYHIAQRTTQWVRAPERGAFGDPKLQDGLLIVGDSRGSLVALDAASGEELGRLDSGHGFAAPAAVAGRRGFVLTNGGVLLALRIAGRPQWQ